MRTRAIFFDVANTLLHKPGLFPALQAVLACHGLSIPLGKLSQHHRLLSEVISFPDTTSAGFYREFNTHLLRTLGAIPDDRLLDDVYAACKGLVWARFDDVVNLDRFGIPLGVLSNWDVSLAERLRALLDVRFDWVLGSAETGVRKPDPAFFGKMIDRVGVAPSEIIFVGDSIRLDIEPALRLGIRALLLDRDDLYPAATMPRLKNLADLDQCL
jgi:FMN phosphatase YigB (HAD superfamily)